MRLSTSREIASRDEPIRNSESQFFFGYDSAQRVRVRYEYLEKDVEAYTANFR